MDYGKNWRLVQDSTKDAFTNMATDEAIARAMISSGNGAMPSLRIYTWKPSSISIGYFQRISDVVSDVKLNISEKDLDIVRRPTGGTAVIHDGGPSFSLILKDGSRMSRQEGVMPKADPPLAEIRQGEPSTRITDLYFLLGRCVIETLRHLGISAELWNESKGTSCDDSCGTSAKLPLYEVRLDPSSPLMGEGREGMIINQSYIHMYQGDLGRLGSHPPPVPLPSREGKVRGHHRFLQRHSSFCASSLYPYDVVSEGRKVAGYAARRFQGVTLLQGYITLTNGLTAQELREAMITAVEGVTGVKLLEGTLTGEESVLAHRLRGDKYTRREWNYKR